MGHTDYQYNHTDYQSESFNFKKFIFLEIFYSFNLFTKFYNLTNLIFNWMMYLNVYYNLFTKAALLYIWWEHSFSNEKGDHRVL